MTLCSQEGTTAANLSIPCVPACIGILPPTFTRPGVRLEAEEAQSRLSAAASPGSSVAALHRKANMYRRRGQHQAAHSSLRQAKDIIAQGTSGGGRPADRSLLPVQVLELGLESALNDFVTGHHSEALCGAVECCAQAELLHLVGHHAQASVLAAESLLALGLAERAAAVVDTIAPHVLAHGKTRARASPPIARPIA